MTVDEGGGPFFDSSRPIAAVVGIPAVSTRIMFPHDGGFNGSDAK